MGENNLQPKSPRPNRVSHRKQGETPKDGKAIELLPVDVDGQSPYLPKHFLDIFLAPQDFFSAKLSLGKPIYIILAGWLLGIALILIAIGQAVARSRLGLIAQEPPEELLASWPDLWMSFYLVGAAIGALMWFAGGYLFKLRVLLSGAPEPDLQLARIVYIYSSLVRSLPLFILLIVWCIISPYYGVAFDQGAVKLAELLNIVFSLGEIITAYIGVRTLFSVDRRRALIWFVVGPAAWFAANFSTVVLMQ